ncbi:MAG TPA: hypothetical protein VGM03_21680, partial [Phycisphaerae bacterium]
MGILLSVLLITAPSDSRSADGELRGALRAAAQCAEHGDDAAVIERLSGIRGGENSYEAQHLLAGAYVRLGQKSEARRCCLAAISLKPDALDDRVELGKLYAAEGKWALALAAWEKAENQGRGDDATLHEEMAVAYAALHQYRGATISRRIPHAVAGQIRKDHYVWGPAPNEPDEVILCPKASAIYHVARALELGSQSLRLARVRADMYAELKDFATALAIYREIEPRVADAERAEFCMRFGEALLAVDDVDGYVEKSAEAARLDPQRYGPQRAAAYERAAARANTAGDLANYVRYLELALEASEPSADLHCRLGNAYWETGRKDDAARHWRITLELEPEYR